MAYEKRVIAKVNELFAQRRQAAFDTQETRRQSIYLEIPRISEIDSRLSMTTMRLAKAAVEGRLDERRLEEIKQENRDLQQQKTTLLTQAGYPADYLKLKFCCEKCEDQGFVGSHMCSCYKEELARCAFSLSALYGTIPPDGFDGFRLDYYEDAPDETGISPRQRMKTNLALCRDFAQNFEHQKKNLLLIGPTGLGKTFLSGCISHELVQRGVDVVYETAHTLFATLERDKFNPDTTTHAMTERYLECELLIIDDLGTEFISAFSTSAFYNLLNVRLMQNRRMIVNSNCTMPELETMYSPRVASRLVGDFTLLKFCGADIRFMRGIS